MTYSGCGGLYNWACYGNRSCCCAGRSQMFLWGKGSSEKLGIVRKAPQAYVGGKVLAYSNKKKKGSTEDTCDASNMETLRRNWKHISYPGTPVGGWPCRRHLGSAWIRLTSSERYNGFGHLCGSSQQTRVKKEMFWSQKFQKQIPYSPQLPVFSLQILDKLLESWSLGLSTSYVPPSGLLVQLTTQEVLLFVHYLLQRFCKRCQHHEYQKIKLSDLNYL